MLRRSFVLAGAAALSACAFKSSPFSAYQPLLYSLQAPPGWRDPQALPASEGVAPGGPPGQAWLFGSVHLGLSRFYPLPDEVESAWRASDSLAVELDLQRRNKRLRTAFSARALLPAGETLDDWLTADEVTRIRNLMQYDSADWQRMRRLQPWALTLNLFYSVDELPGQSSALGVDVFFLKRARDSRRDIFELETPEDQVEAITGGSRDDQLAQLRNRLHQLSRYERTTDLIIEAWRRGDALTLAQLKRDSFGDEHRLSSLNQRMIITREHKMAAALADLIRHGRKVFAVVGAFHLVGPDNMVERLRREHGLDVSLLSA